jgi:hypothetical protein
MRTWTTSLARMTEDLKAALEEAEAELQAFGVTPTGRVNHIYRDYEDVSLCGRELISGPTDATAFTLCERCVSIRAATGRASDRSATRAAALDQLLAQSLGLESSPGVRL